jgi:hypothetical protein
MISKNGKSRFKKFSNLGVLTMQANNALIEQMKKSFLKLVELRLLRIFLAQRENISISQKLTKPDILLADIAQSLIKKFKEVVLTVHKLRECFLRFSKGH